MNASRSPRWLMWSGPVFFVLFGVLAVITGNPPGTKASSAKIIDFYRDHKDVTLAGVFLTPLACALLLVFAAQVRQRARETGVRTTGTSVLLGGAVLWAAGMLVGSMVSLAQVDAADRRQGEASIALNFVQDASWLPFIGGIAVFLIGAGMTSLGTNLLPRWLGWLTLVVGILSLAGPGGFIGFFGAPLWTLVAGIILAIRKPAASTTATPVQPAIA